MNKTEAVQNLRRSNAARPIPSRKPARRGGRGGQKRTAINEQRGDVMAAEYKVTLKRLNKKNKIRLDAVYVTTESMERAERIAKLNRPDWDVLYTKLSGR